MFAMEKATQVVFLLHAILALSIGGSREYHYFPQKTFCRENYLDLATIETEEEWSKVQLILENASLEPWIGLYDPYTSWRWSLDGKYLYQDSDTPFGDWFTLVSDSWRKPTNSYVVNSTSMTWFEAQSHCRLHYTDLTSVRNVQEKDAILGILESSQTYWVGLSRESWKWSDQSPFSLKKWAPNEGLNELTNEFCASIGLTGFKDGDCAQAKPFLCTVPVMKTFKVEIKTDSLNVDDPSAQDSLLQNLERQLKEQGIHQNFTLRWRKQADGKLFSRKKEKHNTPPPCPHNGVLTESQSSLYLEEAGQGHQEVQSVLSCPLDCVRWGQKVLASFTSMLDHESHPCMTQLQ
ncbi:hypothetical protein WMY93_019276 [Mugilogobius chulae]|uniref:C-type lectin domain-containing protein n=1 Tax=Mugilogobius chulae TaxID=88201 RepID=A0AAW0NEW0_9GOBI